jgi:hypothetical protein
MNVVNVVKFNGVGYTIVISWRCQISEVFTIYTNHKNEKIISVQGQSFVKIRQLCKIVKRIIILLKLTSIIPLDL